MIDIIFEDKDIIVIDKASGIAVQTAKLMQKDLVSEVKNLLAKKGEGSYLGVVHRLDQPVSGVVVFAKNDKAAANLSKQLQAGNSHKEYCAKVILASDNVDLKPADVLTDFLVKDVKQNKAFIANANDKQAKKAILEYKIVEKVDGDKGFSIARLSVKLCSGRFHQIRAQLSNAGMIIVGDVKYGFDECMRDACADMMRLPDRGEIYLCAKKLIIRHPVTGKEMCFDSKHGE